jgi:isopentenyl phosphate kinase
VIFLKLGGSLITDKTTPHTHRPEVLARMAHEIAAAREQDPGLRLVIGHGSGSFGHVPAQKYATRWGVSSAADWNGFAEVWREAHALNQLVIDALTTEGIPVLAFPPSACILANGGQVSGWDLKPIRSALAADLVPLVNGDVAFDTQLGGTILSTEDVFRFLARELHPERILLAGIEEGVWADYPVRQHLIQEITPGNLLQFASVLGGSQAVDVTGGMVAKVQMMLELVQEIPGLKVQIFSGNEPGLVMQALLGIKAGTHICRKT